MRGAFTKTVVLILCWKTVIILFSVLATYVLPLKLRFTPQDVFKQGFPYLMWIWGNFDGDHYMQIARTGYNIAELPFFPLHPTTLKIMHSVGIPYLIGGIILCHIAFFTAIYFMCQLLKIDKKQSLYYLMLIIILSFPTSYSYGAVYNDSLFLCMATITLYLGRKKQWILASIFGMIATYSRLNGLALFFYLIAEYVLSVAPHYFAIRPMKKVVKDTLMLLNPRKVVTSGIFSVLLIPLAYVSYLYYIQVVFGNWKLIYSAMYVWRQNVPTFPAQVFWRYGKILAFYRPFDGLYLIAAIELFFIIFYLCILVYSINKIRFSYWLFFAMSILIPSLTGTFAGMPRYGLHLYPFFLSVAMLLEKRPLMVKVTYVAISLALLFIGICYFTRGYFFA